MPDNNEVQGAAIDHRFIPAPVVPSDDECAVCGRVLHVLTAAETAEWHARSERDKRHCKGCGMPAPPTPSQDAEGDGLDELWDTYCHMLDEGTLEDERKAREAVESAIRAPYEELVKAARGVTHGAPVHRYEPQHAEWCEVCAAITSIDESLGGRS